MKPVLVDLFTSKKFLVALTAIVVYLGGRFGLNVDPATLDRVFAALLVYVGAQGAADVGKSAAAISAVSAGSRDAVSAAERIPDSAPASGPMASVDAMKRVAATVMMLALIALAGGGSLTACAGASRPGQALIDCTKADQAQLVAEGLTLMGSPSWSALEQGAIAAGETIGGCALLAVIDAYRPPALATAAPVAAPVVADKAAVVARVRAHFAVAGWHTAAGDR